MSKKISELTELTSPTGTDVLPIVNSGANKKISVNNLMSTVKTKFKTLAVNRLYYLCSSDFDAGNYCFKYSTSDYACFNMETALTTNSTIVYNYETGKIVVTDYTMGSYTLTPTTETAPSAPEGYTLLYGTKMIELVFSDMYNSEYRQANISGIVEGFGSDIMIAFNTNTEGFANDYVAGVVFKTNSTVPTLMYAGTNIIQWIGTDCKIDDGYSVFLPQPNKKYDIIFSFDGECFQGLVCGFTIATSNN